MTGQEAAPHPDNSAAPALFKRAAAHLAAGDPAAATLLPSLEHFPDYAPGWLLIGDVLRRARHVQRRTLAQFSHGPEHGWLVWQALRRKMDREQPDYRS